MGVNGRVFRPKGRSWFPLRVTPALAFLTIVLLAGYGYAAWRLGWPLPWGAAGFWEFEVVILPAGGEVPRDVELMGTAVAGAQGEGTGGVGFRGVGPGRFKGLAVATIFDEEVREARVCARSEALGIVHRVVRRGEGRVELRFEAPAYLNVEWDLPAAVAGAERELHCATPEGAVAAPPVPLEHGATSATIGPLQPGPVVVSLHSLGPIHRDGPFTGRGSTVLRRTNWTAVPGEQRVVLEDR